MTDLRDWIRTIGRASFKGQPFFVDRVGEDGGRGLVIHKFPNRDQPYIEDLGEEPRTFSVTAYLHGNDVDAVGAAFTELMASRGPGLLTLPVRAAVMVRAHTVKRADEKDKLGYIAFDCQFVREGAAFALVSLPALLNAAYGGIDAVAGLIGATLVRGVTVAGVPDHVTAAVYDTLAAGAATFDAVRLSNAVEPAASATLRDRLAEFVDAAGDRIVDLTTMAGDLVGIARDLAEAMPADIAFSVMLGVADVFAPVAPASSYTSPSARSVAINAAEASRAVRLAALSAFTDSILRRSYASRPEGVSARADVAVRFDDEMNDAHGADNAALYVAMQDMRGAVVDYLSRLIADLAPVLTVSANRSLPSLFWAWRLYADPMRAGELVARNSVRHPSFMPESLSALAR